MAQPEQTAAQLLRSIRGDDDPAAERLLPLVYDELRQLADGYMRREQAGHTLQPTALVHEAFFKLVDSGDRTFESRAHFMGVAARAMRQVLVDHARRRKTGKRGGNAVRVTLDEAAVGGGDADIDLIALDEALARLATKKERLARVVELRYFSGLTIQETATVLGVGHTTVEDDWSLARAWLRREFGGDE